MRKIILLLVFLLLTNTLLSRAGRGGAYQSGSSSGSSGSFSGTSSSGSSYWDIYSRDRHFQDEAEKGSKESSFDEKKHAEWERQLKQTEDYSGYFRTEKYKVVFQLKKNEIQVTESFNHISFVKDKKGIWYQPRSNWIGNYYLDDIKISGGIDNTDISEFRGMYIDLFNAPPGSSKENNLEIQYRINNETKTQIFSRAIKQKMGNFSFQIDARDGIGQYLIEFLPDENTPIDIVRYCILDETLADDCKNGKPESAYDGIKISGRNLRRGSTLFIDLFLTESSHKQTPSDTHYRENLIAMDYSIQLKKDGRSNKKIYLNIGAPPSEKETYSIGLPEAVPFNANITAGIYENLLLFIDYTSNHSIDCHHESIFIETSVAEEKQGYKTEFTTFGDFQMIERDTLQQIFSQYNFLDNGIESAILDKTDPSQKIAILYIPLPDLAQSDNLYASSFTDYQSVEIKFPDFIDPEMVLYHLADKKERVFFPLHSYQWNEKTLSLKFYESLEEKNTALDKNPYWIIIYMPGDGFHPAEKTFSYRTKEMLFFVTTWDWESILIILTFILIPFFVYIGYKKKWADKLSSLISRI